MGNSNKSDTKAKPGKKTDSGEENFRFLVLHNDDHHTFDYVIECLVKICGHSSIQAEQCTYMVHYKGSCDILKGTYVYLAPYYKAMAEKELIVSIE